MVTQYGYKDEKLFQPLEGYKYHIFCEPNFRLCNIRDKCINMGL